MIPGFLLPRNPLTPWPMVGAWVYIPRLNVQGWLSFLIDTGADRRCIHLPNAIKLGIDHAKLSNPISLGGIGGQAEYGQEVAGLVFLDANQNTVLEQMPALLIGLPNRSPSVVSLLGMDILSRYQLILDIKSNVVALL